MKPLEPALPPKRPFSLRLILMIGSSLSLLSLTIGSLLLANVGSRISPQLAEIFQSSDCIYKDCPSEAGSPPTPQAGSDQSYQSQTPANPQPNGPTTQGPAWQSGDSDPCSRHSGTNYQNCLQAVAFVPEATIGCSDDPSKVCGIDWEKAYWAGAPIDDKNPDSPNGNIDERLHWQLDNQQRYQDYYVSNGSDPCSSYGNRDECQAYALMSLQYGFALHEGATINNGQVTGILDTNTVDISGTPTSIGDLMDNYRRAGQLNNKARRAVVLEQVLTQAGYDIRYVYQAIQNSTQQGKDILATLCPVVDSCSSETIAQSTLALIASYSDLTLTPPSSTSPPAGSQTEGQASTAQAEGFSIQRQSTGTRETFYLTMPDGSKVTVIPCRQNRICLEGIQDPLSGLTFDEALAQGITASQIQTAVKKEEARRQAYISPTIPVALAPASTVTLAPNGIPLQTHTQQLTVGKFIFTPNGRVYSTDLGGIGANGLIGTGFDYGSLLKKKAISQAMLDALDKAKKDTKANLVKVKVEYPAYGGYYTTQYYREDLAKRFTPDDYVQKVSLDIPDSLYQISLRPSRDASGHTVGYQAVSTYKASNGKTYAMDLLSPLGLADLGGSVRNLKTVGGLNGLSVEEFKTKTQTYSERLEDIIKNVPKTVPRQLANTTPTHCAYEEKTRKCTTAGPKTLEYSPNYAYTYTLNDQAGRPAATYYLVQKDGDFYLQNGALGTQVKIPDPSLLVYDQDYPQFTQTVLQQAHTQTLEQFVPAYQQLSLGRQYYALANRFNLTSSVQFTPDTIQTVQDFLKAAAGAEAENRSGDPTSEALQQVLAGGTIAVPESRRGEPGVTCDESGCYRLGIKEYLTTKYPGLADQITLSRGWGHGSAAGAALEAGRNNRTVTPDNPNYLTYANAYMAGTGLGPGCTEMKLDRDSGNVTCTVSLYSETNQTVTRIITPQEITGYARQNIPQYQDQQLFENILSTLNEQYGLRLHIWDDPSTWDPHVYDMVMLTYGIELENASGKRKIEKTIKDVAPMVGYLAVGVATGGSSVAVQITADMATDMALLNFQTQSLSEKERHALQWSATAFDTDYGAGASNPWAWIPDITSNRLLPNQAKEAVYGSWQSQDFTQRQEHFLDFINHALQSAPDAQKAALLTGVPTHLDTVTQVNNLSYGTLLSLLLPNTNKVTNWYILSADQQSQYLDRYPPEFLSILGKDTYSKLVNGKITWDRLTAGQREQLTTALNNQYKKTYFDYQSRREFPCVTMNPGECPETTPSDPLAVAGFQALSSDQVGQLLAFSQAAGNYYTNIYRQSLMAQHINNPQTGIAQTYNQTYNQGLAFGAATAVVGNVGGNILGKFLFDIRGVRRLSTEVALAKILPDEFAQEGTEVLFRQGDELVLEPPYRRLFHDNPLASFFFDPPTRADTVAFGSIARVVRADGTEITGEELQRAGQIALRSDDELYTTRGVKLLLSGEYNVRGIIDDEVRETAAQTLNQMSTATKWLAPTPTRITNEIDQQITEEALERPMIVLPRTARTLQAAFEDGNLPEAMERLSQGEVRVTIGGVKLQPGQYLSDAKGKPLDLAQRPDFRRGVHIRNGDGTIAGKISSPAQAEVVIIPRVPGPVSAEAVAETTLPLRAAAGNEAALDQLTQGLGEVVTDEYRGLAELADRAANFADIDQAFEATRQELGFAANDPVVAGLRQTIAAKRAFGDYLASLPTDPVPSIQEVLASSQAQALIAARRTVHQALQNPPAPSFLSRAGRTLNQIGQTMTSPFWVARERVDSLLAGRSLTQEITFEGERYQIIPLRYQDLEDIITPENLEHYQSIHRSSDATNRFFLLRDQENNTIAVLLISRFGQNPSDIERAAGYVPGGYSRLGVVGPRIGVIKTDVITLEREIPDTLVDAVDARLKAGAGLEKIFARTRPVTGLASVNTQVGRFAQDTWNALVITPVRKGREAIADLLTRPAAPATPQAPLLERVRSTRLGSLIFGKPGEDLAVVQSEIGNLKEEFSQYLESATQTIRPRVASGELSPKEAQQLIQNDADRWLAEHGFNGSSTKGNLAYKGNRISLSTQTIETEGPGKLIVASKTEALSDLGRNSKYMANEDAAGFIATNDQGRPVAKLLVQDQPPGASAKSISQQVDKPVVVEIELSKQQLENFGRLSIVADGAGGAKERGYKASNFFTKRVYEIYYDPQFNSTLVGPDNLAKRLELAIRAANKETFNFTQGESYTTATALVDLNGRVAVANVGDSRAYLLRHGRPTIEQITKDHSLVQALIDKGSITPEAALTNPNRNIILRSIGKDPDVEVDIFTPTVPQIRPGDRIVLISDGIVDLLADPEPNTFKRIITQAATPQAAAEDLVRQANAIDIARRDNLTAVVVDIQEALIDRKQVSLHLPVTFEVRPPFLGINLRHLAQQARDFVAQFPFPQPRTDVVADWLNSSTPFDRLKFSSSISQAEKDTLKVALTDRQPITAYLNNQAEIVAFSIQKSSRTFWFGQRVDPLQAEANRLVQIYGNQMALLQGRMAEATADQAAALQRNILGSVLSQAESNDIILALDEFKGVRNFDRLNQLIRQRLAAEGIDSNLITESIEKTNARKVLVHLESIGRYYDRLVKGHGQGEVDRFLVSRKDNLLKYYYLHIAANGTGDVTDEVQKGFRLLTRGTTRREVKNQITTLKHVIASYDQQLAKTSDQSLKSTLEQARELAQADLVQTSGQLTRFPPTLWQRLGLADEQGFKLFRRLTTATLPATPAGPGLFARARTFFADLPDRLPAVDLSAVDIRRPFRSLRDTLDNIRRPAQEVEVTAVGPTSAKRGTISVISTDSNIGRPAYAVPEQGEIKISFIVPEPKGNGTIGGGTTQYGSFEELEKILKENANTFNQALQAGIDRNPDFFGLDPWKTNPDIQFVIRIRTADGSYQTITTRADSLPRLEANIPPTLAPPCAPGMMLLEGYEEFDKPILTLWDRVRIILLNIWNWLTNKPRPPEIFTTKICNFNLSSPDQTVSIPTPKKSWRNTQFDNSQAREWFGNIAAKAKIDPEAIDGYSQLADSFIANPASVPKDLDLLLGFHNYDWAHTNREDLANVLIAQFYLRQKYGDLISAANRQIQKEFAQSTDYVYKTLGLDPPLEKTFTNKPLLPSDVFFYFDEAAGKSYSNMSVTGFVYSNRRVININIGILERRPEEAQSVMVHEWNHVLATDSIKNALSPFHFSEEAKTKITEGLTTEFQRLVNYAANPNSELTFAYQRERDLISNELMAKLAGRSEGDYLRSLIDETTPEERLQPLIHQQLEARLIVLEAMDGDLNPLLLRLGGLQEVVLEIPNSSQKTFPTLSALNRYLTKEAESSTPLSVTVNNQQFTAGNLEELLEQIRANFNQERLRGYLELAKIYEKGDRPAITEVLEYAKEGNPLDASLVHFTIGKQPSPPPSFAQKLLNPFVEIFQAIQTRIAPHSTPAILKRAKQGAYPNATYLPQLDRIIIRLPQDIKDTIQLQDKLLLDQTIRLEDVLGGKLRTGRNVSLTSFTSDQFTDLVHYTRPIKNRSLIQKVKTVASPFRGAREWIDSLFPTATR